MKVLVIFLFYLLLIGVNSISQTVTPWITNSDKSKLLQQQAAVVFSTATAGSTTVTVNEASTYQTIDGFGIALTQGSAEVISTLSLSDQTTLLEELYGSSNLGISVVRISIGASDLSSSTYSYQDFKSYSEAYAPIGGYVRLKSVSNSKYVNSSDGNSGMICSSTIASSWEIFKVVEAGNGDIALQGSNGKYVTGSSPMWCNATTIGANEKFSWIVINGQVQLKCKGNNLFVCSENGTKAMNCDRTSASGWETFSVEAAVFSLSGPDLTFVIPILKKIIAINPNIVVLATPWSAPSWMKTSLDWKGGTLQGSYYAGYAEYFKNYLDAMSAQGITIWGITPQNEPENPYNVPSMTFTSTEEFNFIDKFLGPTIRAGGYNTKIIGFDHNCDNTAYPIAVAASSYVDGSAFHLYGGDISALTTVKNATNKNIYFTEQYTDSKGNFGGDFQWHIKNVMIGSVNNWAKIACEWNLATDANYGPHTVGGTTSSMGALTISNPTTITRNVSYYILGQFSKFVKPNAIRIGSSSNNSNLINTAFLNTDGTIVSVILNTTGSISNFSVISNSKTFNYTLDNGAAVSFVWKSTSTSLEPNQSKESINLYPNPSKGVLMIASPNGENVTNFKVFDLGGNLIKSYTNIDASSFDLSDLKDGIYLVEFESNGFLESRKVVIRK